MAIIGEDARFSVLLEKTIIKIDQEESYVDIMVIDDDDKTQWYRLHGGSGDPFSPEPAYLTKIDR